MSIHEVRSSLSPDSYKVDGFDQWGFEDNLFAGLMPLKMSEKNDNEKGSLFFWFVESRLDKSVHKDIPVVVWLNGGPGCTSTVGMFYENGPIKFDQANKSPEQKYNFMRNPNSWNNEAHVLYVEQPVRTGFSLVGAKKRHIKNEFQLRSDFHDFLENFFEVFSEYRHNKLFIAGESYGGMYVPNIALEIVERNVLRNLEGVAIGNGIVDPIQDSTQADFAYSHGLIPSKIRDVIKYRFDTLCDKTKAPGLDPNCDMETMVMDASGNPNEFNTATFISYDSTIFDPSEVYHVFLNDPSVQEMIHVRGRNLPGHNLKQYEKEPNADGFYEPIPWSPCNDQIGTDMNEDRPKSALSALKYLTDSGVRVLLYSGSNDLTCNILGTLKFLENNKWRGKNWSSATRGLLKVPNSEEVAGEFNTIDDGQFGFFIVRNSGHLVPFDQPVVALELITRFLKNKNIIDIPLPSEQSYIDSVQGMQDSNGSSSLPYFFFSFSIVLLAIIFGYKHLSSSSKTEDTNIESNKKEFFEMEKMSATSTSTKPNTSSTSSYQKI